MSVNPDDIEASQSTALDNHEPEEITIVEEGILTLNEIYHSLDNLNGAFAVYDEYSEYFTNLPSDYETTKQDVDVYIQEIKEQEQNQTDTFGEIKSKLEDDIRKHVEAGVSAQIASLIHEEVVRQVKEQVDDQIKDHIPISLQDQAEESKRQLQEIKISLKNSEARTANSFIQSTNLGDPLAPILTSEGNKSPLYPLSVKSLFMYDLDSAKALSSDYGLTDTEDLRALFKQFLKHIGTSVEIVIPGDNES